MIAVEKSSKTVVGRALWTDLTVTFPQGAVTAVIGPSGCGKSTFLNCLGCIDRADSGQILVDDIEVTDASGRVRRKLRAQHIGYLFQDYALIESDNVYDNVRVAARRSRSEVDSLLEEVGLSGRGKDKVYQLSGGQQQRVALVRLLARRPSVVLADEPTGALDRENAAMVMEKLRLLADHGATVVVATHDPWVKEQCDSCLTLGK